MEDMGVFWRYCRFVRVVCEDDCCGDSRGGCFGREGGGGENRGWIQRNCLSMEYFIDWNRLVYQ